MTHRLTFQLQVDSQSGYGAIGCQYFKWLTKRGIFVSLRPTGVVEDHGAAVPTAMKAAIVHQRQPEEFELFLYPPTLPKTPERKSIRFTMWESSEIGPIVVSQLNQAHAIITPSQWCKESFIKSGVTQPITVIPLGFDPEIFKPTEIAPTGPTVFGVAGRVAHCSKRKMVKETMDLFLATFKNEPNVRLHIKIHPTDELKDPKDRRVKIFRDVMEDYQLANWIHGLTAFVTLSRAEGYSLWPLQCMASGRPVVGAAYSGQRDYMNETNSFIVKHREVPVEGAGDSNVRYEGYWADVDQKQAAALMHSIHRNRQIAIDRGRVAAESVKSLTWENSTDKLIAVLEEIGVWK